MRSPLTSLLNHFSIAPLLLTLFALPACDSSSGYRRIVGPDDVTDPAPLSLDPVTFSLREGDSLALHVSSGGITVPSDQIQWTVEPSAVAEVVDGGHMLVAISPAQKVTVVAKAWASTGSTTGSIAAVPNRLELTPVAVTLEVGKTVLLKATPRDRRGNPVPDLAIAWSSSDSAVAEVDPEGVVTAKATGTVAITASTSPRDGNLHESATVTSSAPSGGTKTEPSMSVTPQSVSLDALQATAQLSASFSGATSSSTQGPSVAWTSLDTVIATVGTSGIVTARAVGTTAIVASTTCCGSDSMSVSVNQVTDSVDVSPSSFTALTPGATRQLNATVRDRNGFPIQGASVSWRSSNTAVATVAAGVVAAVAGGTAIISATSGDKAGTVMVSVTGSSPDTGQGQGQGLLLSDGFESGDLNHAENGGGWTSNTRTKVVSTIAHSGTHSLRFHYQAAADGADSFSEQRFDLGSNVTEMWLEFYIYYPDGTEGVGPRFIHRPQSKGSDNNKFLRIWGDEYNAHNKVGASTWPQTNGNERLGFEYGKLQHSIGQYNSGYVDPFVTNSTRGRWLQIRYHAKMSTAATSYDGAIDIWVDGVKHHAVDNKGNPGLNIYDSSIPYWNTGYLLGWANSGFTQDTYVYVDDVKFYDTDPGW